MQYSVPFEGYHMRGQPMITSQVQYLTVSVRFEKVTTVIRSLAQEPIAAGSALSVPPATDTAVY